MRRTLILTALGATTLLIGVGVGTTLASANPTPIIPAVVTSMMGNGAGAGMHDGTGMVSMMGTGSNVDAMNEMHTAMHAAMSSSVSPEQLAACDSAHTSLTGGSATTTPDSTDAHASHHQEVQP
jgi:hypothetical protein